MPEVIRHLTYTQLFTNIHSAFVGQECGVKVESRCTKKGSHCLAPPYVPQLDSYISLETGNVLSSDVRI